MRLQRGLPLGRWLGVPLIAHLSLFPAGALLFGVLADRGQSPARALSAVGAAFSVVLVLGLGRAVFLRAARVAVVDVTIFPFAAVCRTVLDPQRGAKLATPTVISLLLASALAAAFRTLDPAGGVAVIVLGMNLIPGTPFAAGELVRAAVIRKRGGQAADALSAGFGRTASRVGALLTAVAAVAFSSLVGALICVLLLAASVVASRALRSSRAIAELTATRPEPRLLVGSVPSQTSVTALPGDGPWAFTDKGHVLAVLTRRMLHGARPEADARAHAVSLTRTNIVPDSIGTEKLFEALAAAPGGVVLGVSEDGRVRGVWEAATLEDIQ